MVTTTTTEIPRHRWGPFFDVFSRRHRDWTAYLEVLGAEFGAQIEASELALVGITADLKDGESAISVMLGDEPGDNITHTITAPARVMLERTESTWGGAEVLEIESGDGSKVLLTFKSETFPAIPDDVC